MATILLPLDGSDKDDRAIAVAAALSSLTGASAEEVRLPNGSDVGDRLVALSKRSDVMLVVMSTRAPGAVDLALLGSVTQRVVLDSPCPVVVVPPRAQHLQGKEIQLKRVLIPVDGSKASLAVVETLLAWPEARQLELVFIRAVRPEPTGGYLMPPSPPGRGEHDHVHATAAHAERELTAVAERARGRARRADVRVVESPHPGEVIAAAVRQELVDFIAMSTRGMTGIRRVVLGSVAEQVVRASEIPVLLVTR